MLITHATELGYLLTHCQIFDVFEDDQFDFHGYSVRKFTINIYLK